MYFLNSELKECKDPTTLVKLIRKVTSSNPAMVKKITIIGCGEIGSRHLQSLAKLPFNISVDIVEPREEAQKIAKSRLSEIEYDTNHSFNWYKSIRELKSETDAVIIATTAVQRVALICELLEKGHKRFLVEKNVCQSIEEYDLLLEKMKKFDAKGWVNLVRRTFDFYKNLKTYLPKHPHFHLSVITGNEGAGGNSIHFVDLFCWLGSDLKIKLDGKNLINKLLPNKRDKNLFEFAGTITGSSTNGSFLSMTFLPYENLPYMVTITTDEMHIIIDETNERIYNLRQLPKELRQLPKELRQLPKELRQLPKELTQFKYRHISETTSEIVKDIINTDNCSLPTLQESYFAHDELLQVFQEHVTKITNKKYKLCPTT